MTRKDERIVTVGMTGASGTQYGLRLVECLIKADYTVYLMFTKAAQIVVGSETDCKLPGRTAEQTRYLSTLYGARNGRGPLLIAVHPQLTLASGSGAPRRMVVCPASMATVSAIATGASENLLERAADVVIKERGHLVIVPRETPFSAIHLENMLKLSRLGVTILPANPGFYNQPTQVAELVDFIVARILDQLDVEHQLMKRWGRGA